MSGIEITSRPLLHQFTANGLNILQGSDHHANLDQVDHMANNFIAQIHQHRDADIIVLNGDIFNTPHGESSQNENGEVLRAVAKKTDKIIVFVPGNHCLRGSGEGAWDNFGPLPSNVIAPLKEPTTPLLLHSSKGDVVVGNIFYDFQLLDPTLLGLSDTDINNFYKQLPDGQHLLGGNISLFKIMANNLAKAITPDVRVLITHCLPHPSLVKFKAAKRNDAIDYLQQKLSVPFICDPDADKEAAEKWHTTPEAHRMWWNCKSFAMGSNILSHPDAKLGDDLVVIFGHNHRSEDKAVRLIGDKNITFCSFQYPYTETTPFQWNSIDKTLDL